MSPTRARRARTPAPVDTNITPATYAIKIPSDRPDLLELLSRENAKQEFQQAARPHRVTGGKKSAQARLNINTERNRRIHDLRHVNGKTPQQIGDAVHLSDSQVRRVLSKPRP